jgi:hypothetical protein
MGRTITVHVIRMGMGDKSILSIGMCAIHCDAEFRKINTLVAGFLEAHKSTLIILE